MACSKSLTLKKCKQMNFNFLSYNMQFKATKCITSSPIILLCLTSFFFPRLCCVISLCVEWIKVKLYSHQSIKYSWLSTFFLPIHHIYVGLCPSSPIHFYTSFLLFTFIFQKKSCNVMQQKQKRKTFNLYHTNLHVQCVVCSL